MVRRLVWTSCLELVFLLMEWMKSEQLFQYTEEVR